MLMFESDMLCFYGFQSISLMITFDEGWCMDVIGIFLSVVAFRVVLPFDQILQGLMVFPSPVSMDLFHFIFLFSINQIRGRPGEVRAM
jgi:hypothetical protein